MRASALRDLAAAVRGRVEPDAPLARCTTYRIGGPAALLLHPAGPDDVVTALRFARERGMRWMALGLGSNVLIADRGFDGLVIRLGKGLDGVERGTGGEPTHWTTGAGLPIPLLARQSAEAGMSGVQRLIGVPGTVGGGVFMNAGAHGQDLASVVRSVEVVGADGARRTLDATSIPWAYRSSGLPRVVVLSARVALTRADPAELAEDLRRHLEWRKAGTPFSEPCCGSVFRNPPPDDLPSEGPRTAGQLIDAAGLKGYRVGGAEVSCKHANYIVNTGGATAADVLAVIEAVRSRVLRELGVELGLEVEIVG
jgi:UDP-N-acetylmuramate dehydrogenase